MKYQIKDITIPCNRRKEINDKCLYVIENSLTVLTPQDVFNAYTGEGGLHGLEYNNYDSFHAYTEAKKKIEQGQFFTPHNLCQFITDCIKPNRFDLIGDLTLGMGNFFNYLPIESNIYGCELDIKAFKVAKYLYPQANITAEDIRYYTPGVKLDLILGNPPFNLRWKVGRDEYLSQLYYCLKAAELLKPAGLMVLIVPNSFLSDEFMDGNLIKTINNLFSFVCQFDLPHNSFKSLGVDNFQTKVMVFQRISEHITAIPYNTNHITAPTMDNSGANYIYNSYIKPVLDHKEKVKSKLFLENIHNSDNQEERDFQYKVQKILFHIKSNPKTSEKYGKCFDYVNRYYTQKKPEDMKHEEWDKIKLTKNKVLAYLKRVIKEQHKVEIDQIKLVKTSYGLKLKAYSGKTKHQLSKYTGTKELSFNHMVLHNSYPFEDSTYKHITDSKRGQYNKQDITMNTLPINLSITKYLNSFSLTDNSTGETLRLNDMQKDDLGKILQKNYSILNWQQGSGKTLAGITWYKYLLQNNKVRNVFVVSAALGINLTWDVKLKDYGEDFIKIKSLSDIENIQPGQIVIMSFNALIKYQRHIKKFVKKQSQKIALLVDESDELTNHNSERTKATLNCFRRVKHKLLTTGTTTRNNINELYSQLELLYNNSVNMLCDCEYVYHYNKDKELEEKTNEYYLKPFPAYYGKGLFKSCYSPNKVTVFGIKQDNQDIYNIDSLQHLIQKTIITKKFKEIVGRKIYQVKTHRINQTPAEKAVYKKIMQEFYEMLYLFKSTGNSRKDSMLKIIRQIQLLIKSTSTPHFFKEYGSIELPNKHKKIFSLLDQFNSEKVAIGTVFLETAEDYYTKLRSMYPNRPVFLIKGDVTFNKRKGIIAEFEATTNGILISTQQSLKSSVNIPTCNKVIIESMQWNLPKIEQYYFRFIRYNSTENKEVHFVTYDNTIEQNLLALLMAKERLNEYIKTLDFKEQSEIFEEYDIDLDILESIIEKTRDEDGHVQLTWGKQSIQ